MKFGLSWQGAFVANEAEQSGIAAFCTGDFVDHDAYVTLAEMAAGTRTAEIGTAIAYAFSRTPYAHATAIRQLSDRAPGRVFLGLGSGAFSINRDWFDVATPKPAPRMAELIEVVRSFLTVTDGERVTFEGEYYRVDAALSTPLVPKDDIPILVGGFNSGMARMAGRVADGLIGHGLFTRQWWDDTIRPAVQTGRERAGRTGRGLEHGWLLAAVDDQDPERALADVRRMIAFYLTVAAYRSFADAHGWGERAELARTAFAQRDVRAMEEAVTPAMVDEIAIWGTTADAAEMLAARIDMGSVARDILFLAPPSYLVGHRRREAYGRGAVAVAQRVTPTLPPTDRVDATPAIS